MPVALSVDALRMQLGTRIVPASDPLFGARGAPLRVLALDWPELDALLPDGGLPMGVAELSARHALGGATRVAIAAVRAAQRRDPKAWCAWLDPDATLYGPGLVRAGVDLSRLLVVRPPRDELGRVAVKVVNARAFDVVAVDMDPVPGVEVAPRAPPKKRARGRRALAPEVLVRKLAIAAEEGGASVLLLTDASAPRRAPWPVALRVELARRPDAIGVRVAKDRRGRVALARTWLPLPQT